MKTCNGCKTPQICLKHAQCEISERKSLGTADAPPCSLVPLLNSKHMERYKYHSAKGFKPAWIESPKGGEVGGLMEIAEELNLLQHHWIEKCMEADTLRQLLKISKPSNKL